MADAALEARPDAATASLYETDIHRWAVEQAAALRAGRIAELDLANLAEEIDEVGNEQFNTLRSAMRVILIHILKWDHQPERRSRSWTLSIATQRVEVDDVLARNPSLRRRQSEAMTSAYRRARIEAADETGLPLRAFPTTCPYTLADVLQRPFEWPDEPRHGDL